jgi:hypothetical protein
MATVRDSFVQSFAAFSRIILVSIVVVVVVVAERKS